jgi:hypothetical protein
MQANHEALYPGVIGRRSQGFVLVGAVRDKFHDRCLFNSEECLTEH